MRRRRAIAATESSAPAPIKAGANPIGAAPLDGVEGVGDEVVLALVQIPVGGLITLLSRVSAPFRARARPPFRPPPTPIVAPVVMVMLVSAIRFPWNEVAVPSVAELVTCQNTWQELASPIRATREWLAVVKVEPIWKMKSDPLRPSPLRVSVPVNCADELK